MERLTTNKDISEMGMYELAHNCCYMKDGLVMYRDYETDIDIRELARKLMIAYGHWKSCEEYGLDADNELIDDVIFDETIMENLIYDPSDSIGLIAQFYRNLWAMADLFEKLKHYEDLEEQGLLLRLPCKVGGTVWDIDFGRPYEYEVTGFSFGNPNEDYCEDEVTVFDQVIVYYTNSNGSITGRFAMSEIGKTVFLTREEAEAALRQMKEVQDGV